MWLPVKATSAASVVASGISGWAIAGVIGTIIAGIATLVGVSLSWVGGRAKARREREQDLSKAKEAGRLSMMGELKQARDERDEARHERDDYKDRYLDLLEKQQDRRSK